MSEASSCLAASLPKARRWPTRSLALLRVAAVFGSTGWTVGSMAFVPDPRFALHGWAGAVLHRLGVKIEAGEK